MTALLIIDTETGGLDAEKDPLVEVGAVLFDTVLGVPIQSTSFLVRATTNDAEAINGIPTAALGLGWAHGFEKAPRALDRLASLGKSVRGETIFVAHNAAFDRQWIDVPGSRWICTKSDVDWPRVHGGTGSLVTIALAYGVGVSRAHRAIEDCLTLADVLTRVHEIEGGLDGWLARALEPKVEVVACVSYDDRQLAKDAGFEWNPNRKVWAKKVGESRVDAFRERLTFRTRTAGS